MSVTLATGIAYQPLSRLLSAMTYGNALTEAATHTLDYELSRCQVLNGAVPLVDLQPLRTDNLNVTGVTDAVTAANSQTFGYSAANRLNAASGVYGSKSWTYDGVGNRTGETTVSGGTTIDTYTLSATSNRLTQVTRAGATVRAFTYDGAGNILTDNRSGATTTYTYNKRNRLAFLLGAATLLAESRPPRH